ncbi:1,2-phenylacetyl-CoA epoxidase subunit PaaC [Jeotgalibacillus proteolyticus]|uniref:Phenylacetate-CoA oxygenase subunit PaaI n=1 Tax=Jeotgalibacillus proteolyticus TaxID=2082395 RepID=A0A2S5GH87_9BACL|nr:1,2-phenylacetyl-CoA epoxidase subunit PaaC [Jeotgalibacillus proteolyticus]PPA72284.1 phenylacetate-CoA oxygenase subunit PaaI [Jeotgalibacillus proteolyticus]
MNELLSTEEKRAVIELLYQLADDDFIISYRGSEWLGLAPHIEEDVAFSSISQDTMGHAAMYYQLLEELGEKDRDYLSHARKSNERKNAVLLELVNGEGHYLHEPRYDWAFTVVRHYYYSQAKKVKIESLKQSSYPPLAAAAVKISMELHYHLMHWTVWFTQLLNAGGEAKKRMLKAIAKVEAEFEDVLSLGPLSKEIVKAQLIEEESRLLLSFHANINAVFNDLSIPYKGEFTSLSGRGRFGEHTEDLSEALNTLGEVYHSDPGAVW